MLNKRIRSLIDEIFSEMRMTAENLALRAAPKERNDGRLQSTYSG